MARPVIIVALLALAFVTWFWRYDLIPGGSEPVAYRLDRWTGSVVFCSPQGCREFAVPGNDDWADAPPQNPFDQFDKPGP